MKATRVLLVTCIAALLLALLALAAGAEIPHRINYQGRLADTDTGEPVTGPLMVTFRIFDGAVGGSPAWTEAQAVTADSLGVISAILGGITPIDIDFDGPMWLEVEVNGETMSPRREMVSVPYAFYAMNADSLGGMESDSFSLVGHNHDDRYFTQAELGDAGSINDAGNPVDWSKLKNVPAGLADGTDDVGGSGDGYSLDAADGSPTDVVYVDNDGHVGVGTTLPERRLHVYDGYAGSATAISSAEVVVEDDDDARINMLTPSDHTSGIEFGDPNDPDMGWVVYDNVLDRLKLATNNADRVVIDSDGEVGIGTSGPAAPLHIYKNSNSGLELRLDNPNTGSASYERLSFNNEDGGVAFIGAYDEGNSSYPGELVIANNRPGGNLGFYTGGTERLSIDNFGTTRIAAPGGSPLQCSTSGAGYIQIETDNTAPTGLRMLNTTRDWYLINGPGFHDRLAIYDADGTSERLVVDGPTGYVGINNTSPGRHLDVSGRVRATYNGSVLDWTADFRSTNSSGSAMFLSGSNVPGYYIPSGAGLNCNGYYTGGYFRANETGNGGQRAIYCENGEGGVCYICYRTTGGIQYDIYGNGGVGLTVPTSKGTRVVTASQSPEAWIEDCGSGEIKDGSGHVDLDPLYTDCVTIDKDNPVRVFVQMTSPVTNQYYVSKGVTGFDVVVVGEGAETVNATFDYRVVAVQKNRERIRFAEAPAFEEVKMQEVEAQPEQMGEE